MNRNPKEKCRYCKYLGKIYFPPRKDQDAIRLNGCFLFANGYNGETNNAMYLDSLDSHCECFEEDEDETESRQQKEK